MARGKIAEKDVDKLKRAFGGVRNYLLVLMGLSLFVTILCLRNYRGEDAFLWIAMFTGLLGSSTTALISGLNRNANGYEDVAGNVSSDFDKDKERFNNGMEEWFICRPWLGVITSALAYWAVIGGVVGSQVDLNPEKIAVWGMMAGLFAKNLLDIFRNLLKSVFQKG